MLLFLRSPRWWIRPILGMTLALAAFIGVGIAVAWGMWPGPMDTGLWWWVWALVAVGVATASVLVVWVLLLPLLISFLLEDLARRASLYARSRDAAFPGTDHGELAILPGMLASVKVLGATLPTRLGWMGGSFASGLVVPPLGVVVSALGMGHIACIDAVDIALGLRGLDGGERLAVLRAHRNDIRQAAFAAGLLHLGLAATVIGWVLWLPGIVVGAAMHTRSWERVPGNSEGVPLVPAEPLATPPGGPTP
jgi:hypothetical protein